MKQVPVVLVMVGVELGVASLSASAQVSPAPADWCFGVIHFPDDPIANAPSRGDVVLTLDPTLAGQQLLIATDHPAPDGERRVGQEDASPGANLRWLRRLHTSPLETPAPRQQAPAPTHDASTTAQPPSSWPHALKRWSWKIVTLGLGSNNQN